MNRSLISPLYNEASPRLQTRGTKAIRPRKQKPVVNTWFQHKEYHDILLCMEPGKMESLNEIDSMQSLLTEVFHLNRTRQGEYHIGKITRTTVKLYRAR